MDANNSACLSTGDVEWSTPQWLFDDLSALWGPFDLDAAADAVNHKCAKYYTKDSADAAGHRQGGMGLPWFGRTWCNPPYGPQLTGLWVRRAAHAAAGDDPRCKAAVLLIPARTDTAWWHMYCARAKEILFIRGRIPFGGDTVQRGTGMAPFPSAAVLFEGPLREDDAPDGWALVRHFDPPSRPRRERRGVGQGVLL